MHTILIADALGRGAMRIAGLTLDIAAGYAAIIYVRFMPSRPIMNQIRRRGVKQFVEIDKYRWHMPRRPSDTSESSSRPLRLVEVTTGYDSLELSCQFSAICGRHRFRVPEGPQQAQPEEGQ